MARQEQTQEADGGRLIRSTVQIVTAYVERNQIAANEIPALMKSVLTSLRELALGTLPATTPTPAVSIKKSVFEDHIICLEDGKKLTMLKRYLRTHFAMSPEEYRRKWGLPIDYPMVAPAYARLRSSFAKKIGLGKIPTGRAKGRRRLKAGSS